MVQPMEVLTLPDGRRLAYKVFGDAATLQAHLPAVLYFHGTPSCHVSDCWGVADVLPVPLLLQGADGTLVQAPCGRRPAEAAPTAPPPAACSTSPLSAFCSWRPRHWTNLPSSWACLSWPSTAAALGCRTGGGGAAACAAPPTMLRSWQGTWACSGSSSSAAQVRDWLHLCCPVASLAGGW